MSRLSLASLLACLCAAAVPAPVTAQSATLAPPSERISDSVIQQDYAAYERMQERIKLLDDAGRRVADYHLAKAQCWLDVSFHEYTRNDRSAFPQAAMTESERLVAAMEARAEPLPDDTPLVNGAARLRPDLWARLQGLKQGAGFVCAAQKAACAEVELVHAGNEFNQQQWRHAKPYVQIAEDEIAEAQSLASQCTPLAMAAPSAPLPAAVPSAAETRFVMSTGLVFDFDRSDGADIRAPGREQLEAMWRKVEAEHLRVVSIRLVGHADRLNGTGDRVYNQALSERRASTVRELVIAHGIDGRLIESSAVGDAMPVESCQAVARSGRNLEECLLLNRRVDVELTAVR
jgi:OOP family OmpA-OmpF porin